MMDDNELKDILISIQNSIINLHWEITETRRDLHTEIASMGEELHTEIASTREELHTEIASTREELQKEISRVDEKVEKIKLTLENETNKKINILFDSRVDEIRHRKENAATIAKVAELEMRVDNLEKAIKVS